VKDLEVRRRFIALRAQDISLAKIAKELGVSRQTLANWERDHEEEIWRAHTLELDALAEEYSMRRLGRIELIGTSLRRVKEELERRDLSDVPTVKLFEWELKLIDELKKVFTGTAIMSEDDVARQMHLRDIVDYPASLWKDRPYRVPLFLFDDDGEASADEKQNADSN
jgi:transcriptional regulator with XRE-family HTH domain